MTSTQLHERMALMADLIDRAAESPNTALDFDGYMPDIERLFGGYEGLLLSLQHRWLTALTAKLDQADQTASPPNKPGPSSPPASQVCGYCWMRPRGVRSGCGPCNATSSGSSKRSAAWPALRLRRRGRPLPEALAGATRLTSRYAALVVLGWIVVAAAANATVPQLERVVASHTRPFMPATAASSIAAQRSAELFGDATSNNVKYVVLRRDRCSRRIAATTTRW